MEPQKRTVVEAVAGFTETLEDITEELTNATGAIVTKATPLLAPLASGATVLFSVYDGVGRMIDGMIGNPYAASFAVGFVLASAIEGINFASQHARDRAERLKAKGQGVDYINAGSLVTQSFLLTLAVILFLESIPGVVAWWNGGLGTSDMAFRCGLLVLPFFSRIGARIFSVSAILDAIEGSQETRRVKRQQAKREAVAFQLELAAIEKKAQLEIAQMEATAQRKIDAKLNGKRSDYRSKTVQIGDLNGQSADLNDDLNANLNSNLQKVNASRKQEREDGKARMIEIYKANPDASLSEVGTALGGKSKGTVSNWLQELKTEGKVSVNGQVHVI